MSAVGHCAMSGYKGRASLKVIESKFGNGGAICESIWRELIAIDGRGYATTREQAMRYFNTCWILSCAIVN